MDENERRNDPQLDASLSVLGDEGKEPHVGRVGSQPKPQESANLGEALAKDGAEESGGNLDPTSQRAAKDSIGDQVHDLNKG